MHVVVLVEDPNDRARVDSGLSLLAGDDVSVTHVDDPRDLRSMLSDTACAVDVLIIDGDSQPQGGYSTLYDLRAMTDLDGHSMPTSIVLGERPQDQWLAQWAGANQLVWKPVNPFALVSAVRDVSDAVLAPYGDRGADAAQLAHATAAHHS